MTSSSRRGGTPRFLAGGIATALLLALVVYLLFFSTNVPWY